MWGDRYNGHPDYAGMDFGLESSGRRHLLLSDLVLSIFLFLRGHGSGDRTG